MKNENNINIIVFHANRIAEDGINNALEFAQVNDNLHKLLIGLDLPHDEQWDKYGSILNLQDELENNGIPVDENVRKLWDKNALRSKQTELEGIVEGYKSNVIEECKLLVQQFSHGK